MPDYKAKVDLEAGIEYLLATNDSMLINLANIIKENGQCPNEEELTQILVFFLTFSMGCSDLKAIELADIFNSRAEKFIITLGRWGMVSGKYKDYVKNRWDPLTYNRIVNKATAIAAYKRAGSVNKY